jgi:hypothetical protein
LYAAVSTDIVYWGHFMEKDGTWCFSKRHGVQAFCYRITETLNVTICSLFDFAEGEDGGMEEKVDRSFLPRELFPSAARASRNKLRLYCSTNLHRHKVAK